jgi:tRNA (adenine57-N1/adenine58-N1)-methyltransferase catalytic subunit
MVLNKPQEGDLVLLIGKDGKRFTFRLQTGRKLQTHRGVIEHEALLDQTWGSEIKSHLGFPYLILTPSIHDLIMTIKRNTQLVYPKESAMAMFKMNIGHGKRVIEAGTGSGGFTIALAHAVGPEGKVYSYEERQQMSDNARKNLVRVDLLDRVELTVRNIDQGFDQTDVDALFLDVREPWLYLDHVRESMACGGFFGAIIPTTNQIQELVQHLKWQRFVCIEVLEIMQRNYKPVPGRLRPEDRMVGHTGYLVFARSTDRPAYDPSQAPTEDEFTAEDRSRRRRSADFG